MKHTWDTSRANPNHDVCRECGTIRQTFRIHATGRVEHRYLDPRAGNGMVRFYANECVKVEREVASV